MPGTLIRSLTVLVLLVSAPALAAPAATSFETPPTLRASAILPQNMLSAPNCRVDEKVRTDGYLNIYTLHTRDGDLRVPSTGLLAERLRECAAIAAMDKVNTAGQFGDAVVEKGKSTVKGAVNLVTRPLKTVGGALSGVGKMFQRAEESLVESKSSKYEDSAAAAALGYSRSKREIAKRFGVDPYSTNPYLKDRLDRLAGADFAGSLVATGASAAVPGAVGVGVSAAGTSKWLTDMDVAIPPADLRRQNREKLKAMGVPEDLAEAFINNDDLSPVHQTLTVSALSAMPKTANREAFVAFATLTDTEDLALFRERMALMFSAFNSRIEPIVRFERVGRFVAGRTASNTIVFCFPLDTLAWTQTIASLATHLHDALPRLKATKIDIWTTGTLTPLAAKSMAALSITTHQNSAAALLGGTAR
ncbi:hypothetical protein [Desulfolutivibrio sulfoxidireducens]|uniref:hypothetical protein n=1 Tax=Desulfolutivibrio sulfoxidireducens TaxID=2773299 RepID=UPI00159D55EF|nr:hypothetical protein [Desulfolutivibrio sulfoxidireducens]QLA20676.1 hypothetical protein GD604_13625 [Desulfolutivibrio sulfoxidireducens]